MGSYTLLDRFKRALRVSALGDCQRRIAAQIFFPKEVPPRVQKPVFTDGHWHEFEIKRRLGLDGVKFEYGASRVLRVKFTVDDGWTIKGHVDGVILTPTNPSLYIPRDSRVILEAKGLGSGLYWKFVRGGYREALPGYFAQIQGYVDSEFDGVEKIGKDDPSAPLYPALQEYEVDASNTVPSSGLIVAKHKETGNLRTENIEKDTGYLKDLRLMWTDAAKRVAVGELPDRLYDDDSGFECRECFFHDKCWGEVVESSKAVVIIDADKVEAAKGYAVGKRLVEFGEMLMESTKPQLQVESGRAEIGPVKINTYTTTRTLWNHEEIKKILTKQQLDAVTVKKESKTTRIDVGDVDVVDVVRMLKAVTEQYQLPEQKLLTSGGTDA